MSAPEPDPESPPAGAVLLSGVGEGSSLAEVDSLVLSICCALSVKEDYCEKMPRRRTVLVMTLPEASVVVMTVPPLVLLLLEVPLVEEPAPPIGEVELLEVEFIDPPMAPPVGLAEPPPIVGGRVVVMVEPSPLVVVTTMAAPLLPEPPVEVGGRVVVMVEPSPLVVVTTMALSSEPAVVVEMVLSPVATTTVLVPLDVMVAVLPPLMLAYSRSQVSLPTFISPSGCPTNVRRTWCRSR